MPTNKNLLFLLILLSSMVLLLPTASAQDGDVPEPLVVLNENNIKQATVMIMQVSDTTGSPVIQCVGSGTLVSADGLILTNAHLVLGNRDCVSDRLVIALTLRVDEPPVPNYVADIVEINPGFDLAVLQISRFLDGRSIDTNTLQLPFVELGDSNSIALDETLYYFGYPDIQDDPVDVVRGTVSGFTAEARVGSRAWIRTNAEVPGLFSGGGAYNLDGELVGVPTVLPGRVAGQVVDCRQVYDTNGDGQIEESDRCIPIGGTIRAIRPMQLARGLVQAAALGIQPGPQLATYETPPAENNPVFDNLFMSTGVNEAGMPVNVVQSAPQGISSLYLFFDYRNMENGLIYELRTTINGRPSPTYSLPPVTWNGGASGLWYIGNASVPYSNGTYEFTLFIEGRQINSLAFTVGGGISSEPQFSDLVFGVVNSLDEMVGVNYVIPEGNIIRARWRFRNMQPGINVRYTWSLNGSPLAGGSGTITWEVETPEGTFEDLSIISESGFVSGRYRLRLEIEGPQGLRLAALSDFVVAGAAGGINDAEAQVFENFRFSQNQQGGVPLGVVTDGFASGVESVYAFFDWRQISPGTPWTYRWLLDGDVLFEYSTQWPTAATGANFYLSLEGTPRLPDASYTLEIILNGIPIARGITAEVGLGQLPVETFASAGGIQMQGQIIDAETGKGIPGATFIVLEADFSIEDWVWDSSQVLGTTQADRNGFFVVPVLLPRGTVEAPVLYSVLVRADGYYPVSTDGIPVTDATISPLVIEVELNRD